MFTGIIETLGVIENITTEQHNIILDIKSSIANELHIDQSVAHNGICLTVTECSAHSHKVCAVQETIAKTNIGHWQIGNQVNLERCVKVNDRLDGHIVQGHIDCMATCVSKNDIENNWIFGFELPYAFAHLIIEKGSVSINGTSLTCFHVRDNKFEVAIIPYTYHHTIFQHTQKNDLVNIELDIVGKYLFRFKQMDV